MNEEEDKEHKEAMLYRLFWPQAHSASGASHASHPLSTCPTCEDDVHKCECMDNDSLGG